MRDYEILSNECGLADEMVTYLYDEMPEAGRVEFESHLANCSSCIDHFAGISMPRLDVFEWRSTEFSPLRTPVFVLPEPRQNVIKNVKRLAREVSSWLSVPKLSIGLAGLVVVAGLLFLGSRINSLSPGELQAVNAVQDSNSFNKPAAIPATIGPVISSYTKINTPSGSRSKFASKEIVVSTPLARPHLVAAKQPNLESHSAANLPRHAEAEVTAKPPVLSSFEENDDKSLRLSDLFDDIGG